MENLQTQVGNITSNLGNLSAKVDGIQEGIRESLAQTIHNAIASAMGRPTTAESENTQDGACPQQTGTES